MSIGRLFIRTVLKGAATVAKRLNIRSAALRSSSKSHAHPRRSDHNRKPSGGWNIVRRRVHPYPIISTGAEGGIRTPTRLPSLRPERSASTSSTTSAKRIESQKPGQKSLLSRTQIVFVARIRVSDPSRIVNVIHIPAEIHLADALVLCDNRLQGQRRVFFIDGRLWNVRVRIRVAS